MDATQQIVTGRLCPECGSGSTESNGAHEYRCCKCDFRWGFDPEPYNMGMSDEESLEYFDRYIAGDRR